MLFWLVCLSSLSGVLVANREEVSLAAHANTRFSLDMLRLLTQGGTTSDNVFFSPYSISLAMAMTSLGAGGKTLDEINAALHFNEVNKRDLHGVHKAYGELSDFYNIGNADYSLRIANALFATKAIDVFDTFQRDAKQYYKSEVMQLDFTSGAAEEIINQWIRAKTGNRIQELFKSNSFTDNTALVIANAVFFKGTWETQFKQERTVKKSFTVNDHKKSHVDMMDVVSKFTFVHDHHLKAKVVGLPYNGNRLEMLVVLPDSPDGVFDVLKEITPQQVSSYIHNSLKHTVHVKLPKFTLETEYSLERPLQQLGVRHLFTSSANLNGICAAPAKVTNIVHKGFVEVNEKGTTAAAASGVEVSARSMLSGPVLFNVNHPFLFFIVDKELGTVLFTGVVNDPEGRS